MRGRNDGGDTGPPKMVGTDRNRLEAGAGEERKSGGGGRKDHNRNCRDDNGDAGDGVIGFGKGIGGRRSHWGPVAPVGRNGTGRKIKSYTHFQRPEIHGILFK